MVTANERERGQNWRRSSLASDRTRAIGAIVGMQHFASWMRFLEKLLGNLAKVVYEANNGVLFDRIYVSVVDVDVSLVEQMVEDIDGVDCGLTLLFVAENEVDPFMQVGGNVLTFECASVESDEFARVLLGPRRQNNAIQPLATLLQAQIVTVFVAQKLGQIEELWN